MTRRPVDPDTARIAATVASESKPYTSPGACYPLAEGYQQALVQGAVRRRPA